MIPALVAYVTFVLLIVAVLFMLVSDWRDAWHDDDIDHWWDY